MLSRTARCYYCSSRCSRNSRRWIVVAVNPAKPNPQPNPAGTCCCAAVLVGAAASVVTASFFINICFSGIPAGRAVHIFFFFFILRRMGKNKALAHHTSTYFHTRTHIYRFVAWRFGRTRLSLLRPMAVRGSNTVQPFAC